MRCLLISDIHANLYALQEVIKDVKGEYDEVWCLGDLVGYGPHPNECIELLAGLGGWGIAGNHDWAVLGKLNLEDFNSDAQQVLAWTRRVLTEQNVRFLDQLAISLIRGEHFTLVHGSPRHPIWEYLLDPTVAQANFRHFSTHYCLVGHTHGPVMFFESATGSAECEARLPRCNRGPEPLPAGRRLIINPGSVGQPRDGDPRAGYGLIDLEALTYECRRVEYPVAQTQKRMQQLGLPSRLIARLSAGW
jgi:diadenosine tetraphosphatase ApaH/serine/threonine PP2A family protein phosphatase